MAVEEFQAAESSSAAPVERDRDPDIVALAVRRPNASIRAMVKRVIAIDLTSRDDLRDVQHRTLAKHDPQFRRVRASNSVPRLVDQGNGSICARRGRSYRQGSILNTIADYKQRATCLTTFAILSSLIATGPGHAQEMPFIDVAHGTMLIHGNYCGPGNRSPRKPIDALDEACMHHDACSPPRGEMAACSCNDRLDREASAVAANPRYAQSLRDTASLVAETAIALPCH